MSHHLMLRVGLVAIWMLAWGDLSIVNLLSGVAVSSALLLVFPIDDSADAASLRFRPLPALVLVTSFAAELVRSNLQVAVMVLRRHPRMRTGVVACPLRCSTETVQTIVANLLALSPGTMPLELRTGPAVLYVHVLQVEDPERVRRTVARLEGRVVRAFGSAAEVASLGWVAPPPVAS